MRLVKGESKKIAEGILTYLKKNKKESLIPEIIEQLGSKLSKRSSKVVVTTPVKLNIAQKKRATSFVLSLIDQKSAQFLYEVDPSIIDGMKVRYGDRIWDLSLMGEISEISLGSDN